MENSLGHMDHIANSFSSHPSSSLIDSCLPQSYQVSHRKLALDPGGRILLAPKYTRLQWLSLYSETNSRGLPLPPAPNANSAFTAAYFFSLISCAASQTATDLEMDEMLVTQDHSLLPECSASVKASQKPVTSKKCERLSTGFRNHA